MDTEAVMAQATEASEAGECPAKFLKNFSDWHSKIVRGHFFFAVTAVAMGMKISDLVAGIKSKCQTNSGSRFIPFLIHRQIQQLQHLRRSQAVLRRIRRWLLITKMSPSTLDQTLIIGSIFLFCHHPNRP